MGEGHVRQRIQRLAPFALGRGSPMAVITIDVDDVRAQVDRRILSGFAEHLGRCIYGGIYDEGSPLADERGFRKDVLEAVRRLRPPVLRWPGGKLRQRLPLDRRDRAKRCQAPPDGTGLACGRDEPVRD